MSIRSTEPVVEKSSATAHWQLMLRDEVALLAMPGTHHKVLHRQAHTLHHSQLIDADDLSDCWSWQTLPWPMRSKCY